MVNFNFFKRKKKSTGAETPVYRSILTPPMPTIKVPKNENPDTRPVPSPNPLKGKLDPPFDAKVANEESSRFIEGKEKELEDLIWEEVIKAVKKGEKSVNFRISNRTPLYERNEFEENAYKIIQKLDSHTYSVLKNIGYKFVKNNYTFEIKSSRVPRFYVDKDDKEEKLHRHEKGDPMFIKDFSITIYWYDDVVINPLYKYKYCDHLVRVTDNDWERFYNSMKEEVFTKEQIIVEEEAKCQETS